MLKAEYTVNNNYGST